MSGRLAEMTDGWRPPAAAALLVAGGAFVAALVSQYAFGLQPCELCLWQRWPYLVALPAAALAFVVSDRTLGTLLLVVASAAFVATAAIAAFHTGVEFGWWLGLERCAGEPAADANLADFLNRVREAPPARCDRREEFFLFLSMTNWNLVIALGAAATAALAAWRRSVAQEKTVGPASA